MIRRLIAAALLLAFIVTGVLTVHQIAEIERPSPIVLGGLVISAVFNLVQGLDYVRDRLIPSKAARTTAGKAGTVTDYAGNKTKEMRAEETLYVTLSGDGLIDPRLTGRGSNDEAVREFTDIANAVAAYNGRFVLVGAPGAGKSTVLRELMRRRCSLMRPIRNRTRCRSGSTWV